MTCRQCGTTNEASAKFCIECGARLQTACPSCGAVATGGRFCGECGAPLSVTAPAPALPEQRPEPVAERRTTSVLFADLVGFTGMSETRDPEETREFLTHYFTTARTVLERYGGTVEKFIGDAVMAVWGVPVAHEDDAERAVRAGLDLVAAVAGLGDEKSAPGVAVRVGVVTGEVAVTLGATAEGMVAGDAVNTASRVQAAAKPGEVWVDEATRGITAAAITFSDTGRHDLKGKTEPVHLFRADQVVAARGGAQRVDGLAAAFAGRDREFRLVKELFHATADEGRARLVSVVGDAGLGKSRLAWEFEKYVDGIQQFVFWHRGRCISYGEGVAFWAFAEMVRGRIGALEGDEPSAVADRLRATLDELVPDADEREYLRPRLAALVGAPDPALPAGGFERADLFAAWRAFLERLAADGSMVSLVVEDVHWADDGLLDFLDYLVENVRTPLFVLTLSRPDIQQRRPHWGTGRRATQVYLEPLGEPVMAAIVDDLVAGLPGEVRTALVQRAEGVPLYAVETVRSLIDQDAVVPKDGRYVLADDAAARVDLLALAAPPSLTALIAARLDALPPDERRLVQDAAVLGSAFTRDGLAAVSGRADLGETLASLVRKEIFGIDVDPRSPERGQYRFLQGLVRTVAYDTVARRDRKVRHLAAADHYNAVADADDLAAVVASHLLAARDAAPGDADADDLAARAVTLLERAGTRALGLGATTEAARYFQSALDLATEPETQARLGQAGADAAFRAGELDTAIELAERSRALWAGLGRPDAAAAVAAVEADACIAAGEAERGLDLVTEHLPAVDGVPGLEPALVVLLTIQANALARCNRKAEALACYPRVLQTAEWNGDWLRLVRSLNGYGSLLVTSGQPTHGLALINAALDVARRKQVVGAEILPLNNLGAMQLYRDLPAARRATEEGLAACRRLGDRTNAWWLATNLSFAMWFDGSWDDVAPLVEEIGADDPAASVQAKTILTTYTQVRAARGEPVVEPQVQSMIESADVSARPFGLLDQAIVANVAGRVADAAGLAVQATKEYYAYGGIEDDYPLFWVPGVEYALAAGRLAEARVLLDQVASMPVPVIAPYLQAQLPRLRALVACAENDDAAAEPDLRVAIDGLRAYGAPYYEARARLELAELLMRTGRTDAARSQAEAAAATFDRLRATPWAERAATVTSLASV